MVWTVVDDPAIPKRRGDPYAEWIHRALRERYIHKAAKTGGVHVALVDDVIAGDVPQFPPVKSRRKVTYAYVNHNRWVWDCPIRACPGAQVTHPDDRRAFCMHCYNCGDGWYPVIWPDDKAQIEALLDVRPANHFKNWNVGESLEQLAAENLQLAVEFGQLGLAAIEGGGVRMEALHGSHSLEDVQLGRHPDSQ